MDTYEARGFGERGLAEALHRLESKLGAADDPTLMVAEALEWCYSLGQYHKGGSFTEAQESTDGGPTDAALAWVRGQSTHGLMRMPGLVVAVPPTFHRQRFAGGGSVTLARALAYEWRWKPRTELDRRKDGAGRHKLYDDRVAGRAVMPPLRAAQRFLVEYSAP